MLLNCSNIVFFAFPLKLLLATYKERKKERYSTEQFLPTLRSTALSSIIQKKKKVRTLILESNNTYLFHGKKELLPRSLSQTIRTSKTDKLKQNVLCSDSILIKSYKNRQQALFFLFRVRPTAFLPQINHQRAKKKKKENSI